MMYTELQQRINNIHRYTASGGHQWRIVNDRSGKTYKPSKQRKLILCMAQNSIVLKRTPTHSGALWTVLGNSFGSALDCFKDGI